MLKFTPKSFAQLFLLGIFQILHIKFTVKAPLKYLTSLSASFTKEQ